MTITGLGHVLLPVRDMEAAISFYTDALGLKLKFRDGDNYAAIQCGESVLALVGARERSMEDGIAPALKVDDLQGLAQRLEDAGVGSLSVREGQHERSLEIKDPAGNPLVFYSSR